MLINLNHISKSFGTNSLLKDVCLQLNSGEKAGLVGRNGCGKTTLFRLINGEVEADRGELYKHPQVKIGLMQQILLFDSNRTVFDEAVSVFSSLEDQGREIEALEGEIESKAHQVELQPLLDRYAQLQTRWEMEGGYSYKPKTKSVLAGLGFQETDLTKSLSQLSGGELNRLNLAKLLLSKPTLLLLDEPTNHLDISAVEWLENFLVDYPHAFILISHDRYLLDTVVNKIWEIADGRAAEFSGNYSRYVVERENRFLLSTRAYEQQRELIEKTEDFIRRNIAGQNTKQAQSRRKALEKMERIQPIQNAKPPAKFRFDVHRQSGSLVFKISDLDIGYTGKILARRINLSLFRGERVGVVGPNGSGKTTLLKTILGLQTPLNGEVLRGRDVEIGFYDQTLSDINPGSTVLEEIRSISRLDTDETLRGYLARFLFQGDEVFRFVSSLSGGEKTRLALAKLIFSKANTLILDEPTNHLDIPSCEALEAALRSYSGTLIIVSHDRYLISRLVQQIVYLDGKGTFRNFKGTYEEFQSSIMASENMIKDNLPPLKSDKGVTNYEVSLPSSRSGLSKNQRNKVESRCTLLEQEIQRTEEQLEITSGKLSEPSIAKDFTQFKEFSDLHQHLTSRLDQLYLEWEGSLAILETQTAKIRNP
ncbi:MAG: multidrug ABC transporter ATP-binding protein [Acidobacteria bacterium]|nr:MAG: multidrug ABC transporter ATP-binding protein [Acidobacteriota bacterium]